MFILLEKEKTTRASESTTFRRIIIIKNLSRCFLLHIPFVFSCVKLCVYIHEEEAANKSFVC